MENLVLDQLITPWLIFSLFSSPVCLILFEIFQRKFCDCHSWELKGWPVLDITNKNDLYFSLIWETFHDIYISSPNYALLGVGFSFTSVLFLLWTQAVDSFDFGPLFQALLLVDDEPLATKDEVFPQWLTTNFWQGAWKTRQKKLISACLLTNGSSPRVEMDMTLLLSSRLNFRIPRNFGPPHLHVSGGFEDRGITQ